jgi:transposase
LHRDNETHRGKFDKLIYRERNRVERCFNRLKQFRRIATRYEKNAQNYLAMLTIAAIMLWL